MGLFGKKEQKRKIRTKAAVINVANDSRGFNKFSQNVRTLLQDVNGEVYFKDKFEKGNTYFLDKFDWNQDIHKKESTGILYLTDKKTGENFTLSLAFNKLNTEPVYLKTFISR